MIVLGLAALVALAPQSPAPNAACRAVPTSETTVVERDRACLKMLPTRKFEGIWVDAFEASRFVEGARSLKELSSPSPQVWLDIDRPLKMTAVMRAAGIPAARTDIYRPHAYLVKFRGARAPTLSGRNGLGFPNGYGHMGIFPDLVVVDRFDAIVDLGVIN
ncbi:MAG: hypothetical protein ACTHM8_04060 [Sphingomonas sp.]